MTLPEYLKAREHCEWISTDTAYVLAHLERVEDTALELARVRYEDGLKVGTRERVA